MRPLAPGNELCAFRFALFDVAEHFAHLLGAHQRAETRFGVQRVAWIHLFRALDELLHEFVFDLFLDQQA